MTPGALFEDDRDWLSRQPNMVRWDVGCVFLLERIECLITSFSAEICEKPIVAGHPTYERFAKRIWQCWAYHWRTAIDESASGQVDGCLVVKSIRRSQGFKGRGNLGGDPLRDVFLAVSVVQKDEGACRLFVEEYESHVTGLVGRQIPLAFDWWHDFVDALAGFTRPPGKLERFTGRCALRVWLRTVAWNFARDMKRREARFRTLPEEAHAFPACLNSPEETATSKECVERLRKVIAAALDAMDRESSFLLLMLVEEKFTKKALAQFLGIHPGTLSRRKFKVLQEFRDHLTQQEQTQPGIQDCVDYLYSISGHGGATVRLADSLIDELQRVNEEHNER